MDCQHDNPDLHAECSADCLIYDCGSAFACCNSDCHPDADAIECALWEAITLGVVSILLTEKITQCP